MLCKENIEKPNTPIEQSIIYEMHVKGFAGSFLGVISKIDYLLNLGITAIELLPIYSYDKSDGNYWGYAPNDFFKPMEAYGSLSDCKRMVQELHKAGIEVILDVVYNHTGGIIFPETDEYYLMSNGQHCNYSGCGNTLSCNSETMQKIILDSLNFWANEVQIDGFRFDLASILTRGPDHSPMENPPILEKIAKLKHVKLICEPWDPGGLYQLGQFPAPFSEWNGSFRDTARSFFRGDDGLEQPFLEAMTASKPGKFINFVTSHDGFCLKDLVSYNVKHNEANGEENRDGENHNLSYNFGVEGETDDPAIIELRLQQMKNFLFCTMLSVGVPMIRMGDERGHTCGGNNNPWRQDNEINWINWLECNDELVDFTKKLIELKKHHFCFKRPPKIQVERTENKCVIYSINEQITIACNSDSIDKAIALDHPISLASSARASKTLLPHHSVLVVINP